MHYFDVIFEISSTWFTFLMAQDLFPRCSLCLEFSPSLRYILESSYLKFKSQCDKERSPDPQMLSDLPSTRQSVHSTENDRVQGILLGWGDRGNETDKTPVLTEYALWRR